MDELTNYKYQLEQVNLALEADKDNEELLKLKTDIEQVIELTVQLMPEETTSNKSKRNEDLKIGDIVEAKYKGDGKYYEATIDTMSADRSFYVVTFLGYNESQNVTGKEIRKISAEKKKDIFERQEKERQKQEKQNPEKPKENAKEHEKKPKHVKKPVVSEKERSEKEHNKRQTSWQNFTSKAMKNTKMKTAVSKLSSKEESKRTLTNFAKRGKHVFDYSNE
jgi:survival-of-motor-neuron-related-splicing factor 30